MLRNMSRRFLLALVSLIVLAGCAGPYAVTHSTASDWVWSVETRSNNYKVVWMRYDNYGAYCTADASMAKTATYLREKGLYATFEYRSINAYDKDGQNWLNGGGCPSESMDHQVFLLTSIRRACDDPIAPENEKICEVELAKIDAGK